MAESGVTPTAVFILRRFLQRGRGRFHALHIVGADRVVFNIMANDYRLVTAIDYRRGIVFIKWLGRHKE